MVVFKYETHANKVKLSECSWHVPLWVEFVSKISWAGAVKKWLWSFVFFILFLNYGTFLNLLQQRNVAVVDGLVVSHEFYLFYPITLEGLPGTTDEFATIPLYLVLFSAAPVELAKSIPVHSLILSTYLFFCLPLLLFPFTVLCRIVFAKSEDTETWPNHLSFRFLTRIRSASCFPVTAYILLRTSSLVTWSLY